MTLVSAIVLIFLVIDPWGNIPFYLAALGRVEPSRRRRIVVRELLIAYAVMVGFLFAGQQVLKVVGISEPALAMAGGIILFLIALRMVFPIRGGPQGEDLEGEPFIVPLAIPYVAGPSVLAAELLLMSREPERWPVWLLAVSIAWATTAIIIAMGSQMAARLGQRGLIAIERLMGMILVAISVEMFLGGLNTYMR